MRGRRRSRGRRAQWSWASFGNLSWTDNNNVFNVKGVSIYPPGRTQWEMEQKHSDHLTVGPLYLWLNFIVKPADGTGSQEMLSAIDFFVVKHTQDDASTDTVQTMAGDSPFSQPIVPSLNTSWSNTESDGLNGFMWSHRWYPWSKQSRIASTLGGPTVKTANNTTDELVQPEATFGSFTHAMPVELDWQPQVKIATKRRLQRGEGLALGVSFVGLNAGCSYFLHYALRALSR